MSFNLKGQRTLTDEEAPSRQKKFSKADGVIEDYYHSDVEEITVKEWLVETLWHNKDNWESIKNVGVAAALFFGTVLLFRRYRDAFDQPTVSQETARFIQNLQSGPAQ
ncbi:hypothetical protein QOT17_005280 [Balamuthia mandrillaris]